MKNLVGIFLRKKRNYCERTPCKASKNFQKDVFTQLIHDLRTKKTLCHVKDYPLVKLKQLNSYVKKHGSLVNPVFNEQPAFFIDEAAIYHIECSYTATRWWRLKLQCSFVTGQFSLVDKAAR